MKISPSDLGEYGNPINALKAKDYEFVFVLAHPERVPLHNLYEALWFIKTGFPRYFISYNLNFLIINLNSTQLSQSLFSIPSIFPFQVFTIHYWKAKVCV